MTVAKGVYYNKKEKYWDMGHSAFNPSFKEEFPQTGELKNLYSVGPHNFYEIALMEVAFRAADKFVNRFIKNNRIKNDHTQ